MHTLARVAAVAVPRIFPSGYSRLLEYARTPLPSKHDGSALRVREHTDMMPRELAGSAGSQALLQYIHVLQFYTGPRHTALIIAIVADELLQY